MNKKFLGFVAFVTKSLWSCCWLNCYFTLRANIYKIQTLWNYIKFSALGIPLTSFNITSEVIDLTAGVDILPPAPIFYRGRVYSFLATGQSFSLLLLNIAFQCTFWLIQEPILGLPKLSLWLWELCFGVQKPNWGSVSQVWGFGSWV